MPIDPNLFHPAVRAKGIGSPGLTPAERTYVDTLQALVDSLRSDEEMIEAASALNPMLHARGHLSPGPQSDLLRRFDETARSILKHAQAARDARSGMAVELCLDSIRTELDDARRLTAEAGG